MAAVITDIYGNGEGRTFNTMSLEDLLKHEVIYRTEHATLQVLAAQNEKAQQLAAERLVQVKQELRTRLNEHLQRLEMEANNE